MLKDLAEGKEEIDITRMTNLLKQDIVKISEKVTTPIPILNYTAFN